MTSGFDKQFTRFFSKNRKFKYAYLDLFSKEPISTQIAILRRERGLSQRQLAEKVHLPQPAIARIETRGYMPNLITLKKICHALNCNFAIIPG